jgi:uncharacterized membrane protein
MPRNAFFFLPFLLLAFLVFFLLLIFLFALIQVGAITVAFTKLGLTTQQVFWILMGTLLGSMVNIPLYRRQAAHEGRFIDLKPSGLWGHYRIPDQGAFARGGEQTISVNVGGGLIPCLLSLYFLTQIGLSGGLILCLLLVSLASYKLARPIAGVGIGIPFLLPPLLAVLCTWLLAPAEQAPQIAYISGSLGTLIGADVLHLLNKRTLSELQAPLLSIGGAGTFDGIFLSGILAVLLT